jgi:hypothetical protein
MTLPHNLEGSKIGPILERLTPNQTFQKLGLCDSLQQSNDSLGKLKSLEINSSHNPMVTETSRVQQLATSGVIDSRFQVAAINSIEQLRTPMAIVSLA